MENSLEERVKTVEAQQLQNKKQISFLQKDNQAFKLVLTGLEVTSRVKWKLIPQVEKFLSKAFPDVKCRVTNAVSFLARDKTITKVTLDSALDRNNIVDKAKRHKSSFDGVWVNADMSQEKKNQEYQKRQQKREDRKKAAPVSTQTKD